MIERMSWENLRSSGLLWLVNRTLHLFGVAIVAELGEDDEVLDVYPVRAKFRGFSSEVETDGFRAVSRYMRANAVEIESEANQA